MSTAIQERPSAKPPAPPPLDPTTQYARDVVDGRIVAGRAVRQACQRHLTDLQRQRTETFPYYFDVAAAQHIIDFFPTFLPLESGEPFVLPPWLQFCYGNIYGWKAWRGERHGLRKFQHGFFETSKGSGKALALDTPIPTPAGWTTMGEIRVGDQVFNEAGRIVDVTAVSDVMHGHECFEVIFDDGAAIVADAEHLWFTEQRSARRADGRIGSAGVKLRERGRWKYGIRTTVEILRTLQYPNGRYQSANHSIPLAGPIGTEERALPIDPYVLGVWLGDGDSDCGRITVDDADAELLEHVASCGATIGQGKVSPRAPRTPRYRIEGGTHALRVAGLLHNKHIPPAYLRGSVDQRLALLQGLMDTDGSIVKDTGECEFSTTIEALAPGVYELIVSLGIKVRCREREAKLKGRVVSQLWRMQFHPPADLPVFRLRRKLQHQRVRHARRRLSGDRRIVDVRHVPSAPVRCIAVTGESHLYLAGRAMVPTHNTPSAGGVAIYGAAYDDEPHAEIYSTGFDKGQASIILNDAIRMVNDSPDEDFRREFIADKYNIAHPPSGSFVRAMSSQHRSKSGPRPHYVLSDEIHEHRDGTVVAKAESGFKNRTQPLGLKYTNSGSDKSSYCWELHQKSLAILEEALVDEQWFAYVCHLDPCEQHYEEGYRQPKDGCERCDNWRDPAVWPKIAPALGIVIQPKYLQDAIDVADSIPSQYSLVRRLNFCIWTETHQVWISSAHIEACKVEALSTKAAAACAFAFDMSDKLDLTAGVAALRIDDAPGGPVETVEITEVEGDQEITKTLELNFCVELIPYFWIPEETLIARVRTEHLPYDVWRRIPGVLRVTPGPIVDHDLIFGEYKTEIQPRHKPTVTGYDPHHATQFGAALRDKAKLHAVEVPQGRKLSEAFKWFEALVRARRIRHLGNPIFMWNVSNCEVQSDRFRNIWVEKPTNSTKRIDGAVAAVMALSLLMAMPREKQFQAFIFGGGGKR